MTIETDERITEHAAAKILGLKVTTLRDWRFRKLGPPFCRFGRAIRYSTRALEAYANQCEVSNAGTR
jgi:hypothetical protein